MRIFFRKETMRLTVSGVGRLVKEPVLEKTANDKSICKFTVASDNGKEDSCFYWCIAYGKTAEFVAKYFAKGKPIHISGEWGQYESDKDKKRHSYVEIRAVDFVPSEGRKAQEIKDAAKGGDDDDIPF